MEYTQALAAKRIRVNSNAPGSIYFEGDVWDTARQKNPALYERILASIPSGRYGTPEEVAHVATFLEPITPIDDLSAYRRNRPRNGRR